MRLLVGDIGGTKTALALVRLEGAAIELTEPRHYPSRAFETFEEIVQRYLQEVDNSARFGAFAIAGAISGRSVRTTNLPWTIDADTLEAKLGFAGVELLNDLEALAWSIPALTAEDLAELHPGSGAVSGNACVVAAGTGLGQAGLFWDGVIHHAFATEGGHTDFAPADDREFALLQYLKGRFGRVSWERVVSGPGLALTYRFLLEYRQARPLGWLSTIMEADGDLPAAVAQAAGQGRCPICVEAMELFLRLYGREAGNAALKFMALGGVYLGGGIIQKNLELVRSGPLVEGFLDKGRMCALMERMPVRVILQAHAPLLGAARFMAAR